MAQPDRKLAFRRLRVGPPAPVRKLLVVPLVIDSLAATPFSVASLEHVIESTDLIPAVKTLHDMGALVEGLPVNLFRERPRSLSATPVISFRALSSVHPRLRPCRLHANLLSQNKPGDDEDGTIPEERAWLGDEIVEHEDRDLCGRERGGVESRTGWWPS
jgi:hypothetical protein